MAHQITTRLPLQPGLPPLAAVAYKLARLLLIWHERRCTRQALAWLDEDRLRDIGLTPSEAEREAARPFWAA
ncbi:DUF1127 domain-containing protein [Histidinibacterium aquaticum]|uniref:DUF1127 domain-containing protein n=1 Tax=Histidinibacterium aquaticum TaxID=2613962 RepID=A0A5J5GNM1_9RHOB|nr:DUF1127 domain-containing protein [Histidinibacterium aquaticum]KAA9009134.1 DUF1127 domain-containing protein [Histidinibacterium aquaticum]